MSNLDPFPNLHRASLAFDPSIPDQLSSAQLALAKFTPAFSSKPEIAHKIRIEWMARVDRAYENGSLGKLEKMGINFDSSEIERDDWTGFELLDTTFDVSDVASLSSAQLALAASQFHPDATDSIAEACSIAFSLRRRKDQNLGKRVLPSNSSYSAPQKPPSKRVLREEVYIKPEESDSDSDVEILTPRDPAVAIGKRRKVEEGEEKGEKTAEAPREHIFAVPYDSRFVPPELEMTFSVLFISGLHPSLTRAQILSFLATSTVVPCALNYKACSDYAHVAYASIADSERALHYLQSVPNSIISVQWSNSDRRGQVWQWSSCSEEFRASHHGFRAAYVAPTYATTNSNFLPLSSTPARNYEPNYPSQPQFPAPSSSSSYTNSSYINTSEFQELNEKIVPYNPPSSSYGNDLVDFSSIKNFYLRIIANIPNDVTLHELRAFFDFKFVGLSLLNRNGGGKSYYNARAFILLYHYEDSKSLESNLAVCIRKNCKMTMLLPKREDPNPHFWLRAEMTMEFLRSAGLGGGEFEFEFRDRSITGGEAAISPKAPTRKLGAKARITEAFQESKVKEEKDLENKKLKKVAIVLSEDDEFEEEKGWDKEDQEE